MGAIHYEAVFSNGEFKRSNVLADLVQEGGYIFLVRKTEGYSCMTYSHYEAQVVDESDKPSQANINGFRFDTFRITGNASNYHLSLSYYTPEGVYGSRDFRDDISYNHPSEGYSRIQTEWSIGSQYKDIFAFFENVSKYGKDVYMQILELERDLYAKDAAYRQEHDDFNAFNNRVFKANECVQELMIPEGWKDINTWEFKGVYYKNLQQVFLPETINWIGCLPFCFCGEVKRVFCYAKEPPRIGEHYRSYSPDTVLYVPKESLDKYADNPDWSEVFPVIKVF